LKRKVNIEKGSGKGTEWEITGGMGTEWKQIRGRGQNWKGRGGEEDRMGKDRKKWESRGCKGTK
jgi:hypothetical protein